MKTYHRKLKLSKVQRAFGTLISLIEDGAEFPTAHERVCEELQLSESQSAALVRLYDTLPTGRAADQNSALAPAPTPEESGADSAAAAVNSGGATSTVRAFNTGRLYTEHGQRIAWTVLDAERVAMVDLDLMIEYVLTLHSVADLAPLRDSDVLKAYDTHKGSMRGVYNADFQAIKSALYAAARECVSVKS